MQGYWRNLYQLQTQLIQTLQKRNPNTGFSYDDFLPQTGHEIGCVRRCLDIAYRNDQRKQNDGNCPNNIRQIGLYIPSYSLMDLPYFCMLFISEVIYTVLEDILIFISINIFKQSVFIALTVSHLTEDSSIC